MESAHLIAQRPNRALQLPMEMARFRKIIRSSVLCEVRSANVRVVGVA